MLSKILRTSRFVTRWANAGYRLVPPCSIKAKWNAAGVGDSLYMVVRAQISVSDRNGGKFPCGQAWGCLRECKTGIKGRIIFTAAVLGAPTRVPGELREGREAPAA